MTFWAFGEKGQAFRFNGTVWAQLPSGSDFDFYGVTRTESGMLLAVRFVPVISMFEMRGLLSKRAQHGASK